MQAFVWKPLYWYVLFLALLLGGPVTLSLTQNKLFASPALSATAQTTVAGGLDVNLATSTLKPGQQSTITATLRDSTGQPVANQLIVFFGGLGAVSPASAVTDAQGRVNAIYTAGSRGGQSQVTVLAGYASRAVTLQIAGTGSLPGGNERVYLPTIAR